MLGILKNRARRYIYPYGLKAGLPFAAVQGMVDICEKMPRLRDHLARRRLGERITATSPWRDFVPRDKGACTFAPGEVPGLERMVEVARELYESRKARMDEKAPNGTNPFYTLLEADDSRAFPELLEIAVSAPLVESATGYFGAVPRLEYIDIWVARPNIHNDGPYNSQLFHLDKIRDGYLKVFVNLFEVTEDNGPTIVLPADKSAVTCRAIDYERRAVFGNGRASDEEVFATCQPEDCVNLVGPAGTGAMVDVSTCLHYGSRCRAGERVTLLLGYRPAYRAMSPHVQKFVTRPAGDARLIDLLLDGSPAARH